MSDIRQWLEELGLGQYADAFEENDITSELLPDLNDQTLKDIGVASAGHRIRVLKAVAALFKPTEREESAEGASRAESPPQKAVVPEAERRQLTVMFCDLVGSTALSEKLDPEDLRAVMAAYRKAVGEVIKRFDGHVAQYLGDGVMAYFGWPRAHEDDAERSVRSALAILDAIKRVEAPATLEVRLGMTTGHVVVGEGADDDAQANKLAVGETPNIAARLQALAGPDQIVIGPGTHRLVGGAFEYRDLGECDLKGILEPVQAWQVTGASQAESRFEAQAVGGLTPFVGRETEIQLLLDRWRQAEDGEGQVVLLQGEPGIGKSRVTQVLRERVADEPHVRLRYQCSPFYTNSAFYPIIGQLERAAGFARDDTADQKLDKLETLLAQGTEDVAKVAPLLASLLSLPVDRYPPLNLSPQRQKDDTIAALAAQVMGLAEHQPLLMLFEDAHWCDPTTLEVLSAVIGRIEALPVLLVITYRPEFDPPWTGHGHVVAQSLSRLGKRQGADMVAKVTGGKALPDEVLDQIIAKTDGVPLFVEELTKTVLEAGFLREEPDRFVLDGPLPPLAIPTTLQDSLMARLDRLATVKEIAQIGACIGREFSYDLLAVVSPLGDSELQDALCELAASELVFRRGAPPDATYVFKHALVQDAAYHSLLKNKRQEIHRNIAQTLEEKFPQTTETQPELLAHHFTEAGLAERAIAYWHRAGQRATEHSANREAVGHLTKGLDILRKTPATPGRKRQELALQIALGAPIQALKGQAAPETATVFRRARELCEQLGDTRQLSTVLHGLHAFHMVRGELPAAMDLAEECYHIARHEEDGALLAEAHLLFGSVSFHLAKLTSGRDDLEKAVHLYDPSPRTPRVLPAGVDLRVFGKSYLSHAVWYLGYPDRAVEWSRAAAADAAECSHFFSQALAAAYAGMLMQFLGDARAAKQQADVAIALCTEHKFAYYLAWARVIRGWALARERREDEGIIEMREGLAALRATGAGLRQPYYLGILAETLGAAGRIEEASDLVARALAVAADHGEQFFSAELHRIEGELLRQDSRPEAGESSFSQAIAIARSQKARSTELRAATDLARLWHDQGRAGEARDLLCPVYDWFAEGFDTADLKEAKALLEELK